MALHYSSFYSVEMVEFVCHLDFTWNQSLETLNGKRGFKNLKIDFSWNLSY